MSVKQVAGGCQDPRTGRNSIVFPEACLISQGHGGVPS